ncbi:hypothetical protein B0T25DRAFT_540917 [Lasiosphaeria hispida]|uniref:F-box domain-containing protein n=1 Tax=Lasiosphaeria hispida TaxID=260671 RepID=A0AAJ0HNF6_9PEZI|nr:hypothetical protein B0T25DRAFT_540917 [Lasiosphaeria hispida]
MSILPKDTTPCNLKSRNRQDMASYLCNLPEELLLLIMESLDPTSIECLRRTSRLFLRLFSSPCFSHQHNKELSNSPPPSWMPYTPWARPSRAFEAEAHTRRFIECLERDAKSNLCTSCQAAENKLEGFHRARNLVEKSLYCMGCDEEHPLAYFSAAERQRDEKSRICIGYEGHFRLCEHKTVDWQTVAKAMRQLTSSPSTDEDVYIILLECKAAIHLPTNHVITAEKWTKTDIFPRLALFYHLHNGFLLTASWVAHLPLPEPASSGRYSVGDMTDRLRLLRRGAAEYIAPQSGPGYLPEMRLFDPNRCNFLDYTGTPAGPGTEGSWSLAPPSDSKNQSCRTHPGSGCSLRRLNPAGGRTTDENGCRVGSHVMRTWFGLGTGRQAPGLPYGLELQAEACGSDGRCLELLYKRDIVVAEVNDAGCRKITHSWCEAIQPESYKLAEDSENYGTLWCFDPTCANHCHFGERPVMRKCRREVGVTADWFHHYGDQSPTTESKPLESEITNTNTSSTAQDELNVPGNPSTAQDELNVPDNPSTAQDELNVPDNPSTAQDELNVPDNPSTAQNELNVPGNPSTGDNLQPKTRRKHGEWWSKFLAKCCGRLSSC